MAKCPQLANIIEVHTKTELVDRKVTSYNKEKRALLKLAEPTQFLNAIHAFTLRENARQRRTVLTKDAQKN